MDTCELQDEICVRLLAAAAPDEVLVAAAKLGDRPLRNKRLIVSKGNFSFEAIFIDLQ
jgi:hypothetical protein